MNKRFKIKWYGFFLFLSQILMHSVVTSQQLPVKFNEIFAPSPNAASLGKFGDIPVSLATGIPKISVPIHSYKGISNHLNLQVSLDYHAGGIKLGELSSKVWDGQLMQVE